MTGYRIDDLARVAGTTVRNVRAYQERGLLAPPRREGRIVLYGDGHLARLRLILSLLERGATLALIGDLVAAWEGGHSIADALGLEAALLAPVTEDAGDVLGVDALAARLGVVPSEAELTRAVELGILGPCDAGYVVLSPRLLQIGVELVGSGVPVSALLGHVAALRGRVDAIVEEFMGLATEHLLGELLARMTASNELHDTAALIRRLRPVAKTVVDIELDRALDSAIADTIARALSPTSAPR